MGFSDSSIGKESACNAGDPGSIPGSERSAGEGIGCPLQYSWASLVAQLVKNPPTMRETWVWSLGWENPLEKGIPTPVFWPAEFYGLYIVHGVAKNRKATFTFQDSVPQGVTGKRGGETKGYVGFCDVGRILFSFSEEIYFQLCFLLLTSTLSREKPFLSVIQKDKC